MDLIASVTMTSTKSILPETLSFASMLLHHKERSKPYSDIPPKFNNSIVSNIEEVNYNFKFKDATSQPERMDLVESTRNRYMPMKRTTNGIEYGH